MPNLGTLNPAPIEDQQPHLGLQDAGRLLVPGQQASPQGELSLIECWELWVAPVGFRCFGGTESQASEPEQSSSA